MFETIHERKAAVIVTTAHAETMAVAVEAEQGDNDQIESARGEQAASTWQRFRNPKTVQRHPVAGLPAAKPKAAFTKRVQHR